MRVLRVRVRVHVRAGVCVCVRVREWSAGMSCEEDGSQGKRRREVGDALRLLPCQSHAWTSPFAQTAPARHRSNSQPAARASARLPLYSATP